MDRLEKRFFNQLCMYWKQPQECFLTTLIKNNKTSSIYHAENEYSDFCLFIDFWIFSLSMESLWRVVDHFGLHVLQIPFDYIRYCDVTCSAQRVWLPDARFLRPVINEKYIRYFLKRWFLKNCIWRRVFHLSIILYDARRLVKSRR